MNISDYRKKIYNNKILQYLFVIFLFLSFNIITFKILVNKKIDLTTDKLFTVQIKKWLKLFICFFFQFLFLHV